MTTTICTTFSAAGWEKYARLALGSWDANWPVDVALRVYPEGIGAHCVHSVVHRRGVITQELRDASPERAAFVARYADDPEVNGAEQTGRAAGWSAKNRIAGYCYRYDAVKFSAKVFALAHAATRTEGVLVWVDADVLAQQPITHEWLESLLPDGSDVCHLGRTSYSECGLLMFRLPHMRAFLAEFARLYASGEVFRESEWHDSWVFDRLLERMRPAAHNLLAPKVRGCHRAFEASALHPTLLHFKGPRKGRMAAYA